MGRLDIGTVLRPGKDAPFPVSVMVGVIEVRSYRMVHRNMQRL